MPNPKSVEQFVKDYMRGRKIADDSLDDIVGIRFSLYGREKPEIRKEGTYEERIRENKRLKEHEGSAEAVIRASDPELVKAYNDQICRINAAIDEVLKDAKQKPLLLAEIDIFERLVREGWVSPEVPSFLANRPERAGPKPQERKPEN